ncbi:MAG: hypothetical protein IPJ88_02955 [Myxococcales bacterium]|nr:MAG: hypothetical protein IPJ88_02955 [Myxococcales bacterium]
MKKNQYPWIALAIVSLCFINSAHAENRVSYTGIARNEDKQVVYVEKHLHVFENDAIKRSRTRYYSPDGKLIAELNSSYSFGPSLPEYRFIDHRSGLEEGVRRDATRVTLYSRAKRGAAIQEKTFKITEDMKAGQGLHQYMREHLDKLAQSKEFDLQFLIPNRLEHYAFVIEPVQKKDDTVSFRMEIDSWLLNLFAGSLTFTYDRSTRHLIYYKGPSNLTDDEGDAQEVRIHYHYPKKQLTRQTSQLIHRSES